MARNRARSSKTQNKTSNLFLIFHHSLRTATLSALYSVRCHQNRAHPQKNVLVKLFERQAQNEETWLYFACRPFIGPLLSSPSWGPKNAPPTTHPSKFWSAIPLPPSLPSSLAYTNRRRRRKDWLIFGWPRWRIVERHRDVISGHRKRFLVVMPLASFQSSSS